LIVDDDPRLLPYDLLPYVLFEQDVKVTVDETIKTAAKIFKNIFILKTGFWFKTSGKCINN